MDADERVEVERGQARPGGALVEGHGPEALLARGAFVGGVVGGERAQADGGEQGSAHDLQDALRLVARQQRVGQADRMQLMRAEREVRAASVHDVGQVAVTVGPEGAQEGFASARGEGGPVPRPRGLPGGAGEVRPDDQRAVPQRLDLDREAAARGLRAAAARGEAERVGAVLVAEQALRGDADAAARARPIALQDREQRALQLGPDELVIPRRFAEALDRHHPPQAGVERLAVAALVARAGTDARPLDLRGETEQKSARIVRAAGGQAQAGERDERLPRRLHARRIAGHDRPARAGRAHDEGVGGATQVGQEALVGVAEGADAAPLTGHPDHGIRGGRDGAGPGRERGGGSGP